MYIYISIILTHNSVCLPCSFRWWTHPLSQLKPHPYDSNGHTTIVHREQENPESGVSCTCLHQSERGFVNYQISFHTVFFFFNKNVKEWSKEHIKTLLNVQIHTFMVLYPACIPRVYQHDVTLHTAGQPASGGSQTFWYGIGSTAAAIRRAGLP